MDFFFIILLKPACKNGYFGFGCLEKCTCQNGYCDNESGNCTCEEGWNGLTCDESNIFLFRLFKNI